MSAKLGVGWLAATTVLGVAAGHLLDRVGIFKLCKLCALMQLIFIAVAVAMLLFEVWEWLSERRRGV